MPTPTALIHDDPAQGIFRVHRSTMTSPDILELERQHIFDRCWLYVGHDSELAAPGDFRRRNVAGRSIMFVRSDDGEVRAFHNTCPHRGAIICRHDEGNAKVFQCFYHAWTFNSRGRLVGIPGKDAYAGSAFDQDERSLTAVRHLESYRGFWFVSFAEEIESLSDYLAGAKEFLDIVIDQSADGEMQIAPGSHRYATRANWKLLVENSIDGYHGQPTHKTYVDYVMNAGGMRPEADGRELGGPAYSLGNGHAVVEYWAPWGRPVARWVPQMGEAARDEIAVVRAGLEQRCGPERAERVSELNRNLLIYPNLVVNDIMSTTVRTFNPLRPDFMEINAWALAPAEETGDRLQLRLHNFLEFLGPGGFATPDDVEALESCQIGFRAGGQQWNDISRGMMKEHPGYDDELQIRAFWRQWSADVEGHTVEEWADRPGPASKAPVLAR